MTEGMKSVRDQRAQVVLCGGVQREGQPFQPCPGSSLGHLEYGRPSERFPLQAFCMDRKGTVLGEGCGVVALELESSARKRGVPCVASMTGYGWSCEITRQIFRPNSQGFQFGHAGGLDRADLKPSDIDLVIAHGDGTVIGDGMKSRRSTTSFLSVSTGSMSFHRRLRSDICWRGRLSWT